MALSEVRYYFGRLNLIAGGREKTELLRTALASHAVLEVRGQRWGFYEFAELESFLTGFLVKYRPTVEEEVVVPERGTLEDKSIENRVTAKCRFLLHAQSGLIAYHPITSQIPRKIFAARFAEVFEHALQSFFVNAEIQSIEEEHRLLDELSLFTTVHRVSIALHPSNPSSRDIWRRVDERIRAVNADSYRENYESDPKRGSLRVADDKDIREKIAMAEDGYGKVDVTGERGGKVKTVSTRDNPMSALAPSDDEKPEPILAALRETIESFLARFK